MTYRRALLLGTLTVGTLDILDATIFFGIRSHVAPTRVFQSIAAGLLGKASFTDGASADLLRLHGGAADLAPITTVLEAARELGNELARLDPAQREVNSTPSPLSLDVTPPTPA